MALTARQARFVAEYLIDLNGTQAAIRAGYSKRTANEQAVRLLANISVAEAVRAAQDARAKRTKVTQDMVLAELTKVGFASMRQFISIEGTEPVINMADTPDEALDALAEVQTETRYERDPDSDDTRAVRKVRIKLHDKLAALDKIARHLGMYASAPEGEDGRPVTVKLVRDAPRDG